MTRETRETYEAVADRYADRHVDRTGVMDQFERFLDRIADAGLDHAPVLDVGCGPGWETAELARRGYRAVGIDVTRRFLEQARVQVADESLPGDAAPAAVAAMDMRHLGVHADTMAGAWACASVHHVPREDVDRVFAECSRVLRDGGVLAVAVKRGDGATTGDSYPRDDRHFTRYQPDALRDRLTAAGFEVEDVVASAEWVWAWAVSST